jgi:hypothetical protein
MIATLQSSGITMLMWLLLACSFWWVWKPLRELINEWRLMRICQKYHHIALSQSTAKRGGTPQRQEGKKMERNSEMGQVVKDILNRCFLSIIKFLVQLLWFLCRQSVDTIADGIIMIASFFGSNKKVDHGKIYSVSQQVSRSSPKSALIDSTYRHLPASNTMLSMSMVTESYQVTRMRNLDLIDKLPRTMDQLESPTLNLQGEAIEHQENHSLYVQQPRRLRPLSPSKRLRRINVDSSTRHENAQGHEPQNAANIRVPALGAVTTPKGLFRIDAFSLSVQMNKRRMNGKEIIFGNEDAKKRRLVNGRASLQGCARRPVSRARLTKRVRAEREEVILEGMSRKRSKPNPGTDTKATVAASGVVTSVPQTFQFLAGNQASAARGNSESEKVSAPPFVPSVFGQNNKTTTASSSSAISEKVFQYGKNEIPTSKPADTLASGSATFSSTTPPFTFGTAAVPAISAASTHPASATTAPQTPQPLNDFADQSSSPAAQAKLVPLPLGEDEAATQCSTGSFGQPPFGFQDQSILAFSSNGEAPTTNINMPASSAYRYGTAIDEGKRDTSSSNHHAFLTSKVISLGAGRQVDSKLASGPSFGGIAENGSTPSFPIASPSTFGDVTPISAAPPSNRDTVYGGINQDGQTLTTNPGVMFEGSDQNSSISAFLKTSRGPASVGNRQSGPPFPLSIGPTFGDSDRSRSTPAVSLGSSGPAIGGTSQRDSFVAIPPAAPVATFGGSRHGSLTTTFSTASSGHANNSQSSAVPALGDKSSPQNGIFGNNNIEKDNLSAGEQKENTNPFGFPVGGIGSTPGAPIPCFGQGGAHSSIKTPPSDGLKSLYGSNGSTQPQSVSGMTSSSGVPSGPSWFVPGSSGVSGGTNRTRVRHRRQRPR